MPQHPLLKIQFVAVGSCVFPHSERLCSNYDLLHFGASRQGNRGQAERNAMLALGHLQHLRHLALECRKGIRNERRNQTRKQKRRCAGGHGAGVLAATLAVYVLSGSIIELATQYWCQERRRSACTEEDCSNQRGRKLVDAWIDNTSLETLREATAPTTEAGILAQKKAAAFLARAGAAMWATKMIKEHGHAPSTQELRDESDRIGAAPSATGAGTAATGTGNSVRQWGWRWRKAWGFRKGRLRVRERYDTEDLRQKAAQQRARGGNILCHGDGFISGPGKWAPQPPTFVEKHTHNSQKGGKNRSRKRARFF